MGLQTAVIRFLKTIYRFFSSSIDPVSPEEKRESEHVQDEFSKIIEAKRKHLEKCRAAIAKFMTIEHRKYEQLRTLTGEIKQLEEEKARDLTAALDWMASLNGGGLAEAGIRRHPAYRKYAAAFDRISSSLERKQKRVGELEKDFEVARADTDRYRQSLRQSVHDLEKLEREASDGVGEMFAAEMQDEWADLLNPPSDDGLEQLRETRLQARIEARVSRELADAEFEFDRFLGLSKSSSPESGARGIMEKRSAAGQILYLLIILVAVCLLWDSRVLYPLKILVVFFHEASHALMAILTGGSVKEMEIVREQGGHVLSVGGSRFLTLTAGYLGSLLWGSLIYLLAVRTRQDRVVMGVLGGLLIVIALLYVRSSFGLIFSLVSGSLLILLSLKVHELVNELLLILIGMTSMIYVPIDIYSDTISRSHLRSDARMLAEEFGGTTMLWGGLWILISAFVIFYTVKRSLGSVLPPKKRKRIKK